MHKIGNIGFVLPYLQWPFLFVDYQIMLVNVKLDVSGHQYCGEFVKNSNDCYMFS